MPPSSINLITVHFRPIFVTIKQNLEFLVGWEKSFLLPHFLLIFITSFCCLKEGTSKKMKFTWFVSAKSPLLRRTTNKLASAFGRAKFGTINVNRATKQNLTKNINSYLITR